MNKLLLLFMMACATLSIGPLPNAEAQGLGVPAISAMMRGSSPLLHQAQISSGCYEFSRHRWVSCGPGCRMRALCDINLDHSSNVNGQWVDGCVCLVHRPRSEGATGPRRPVEVERPGSSTGANTGASVRPHSRKLKGSGW
jgi:hypothetical protein